MMLKDTNIEYVSRWTLAACDQSYNPDLQRGDQLSWYLDSGSADTYPNTMPENFWNFLYIYDSSYNGLSGWKVIDQGRIDHSGTGFGATIYSRTNADGKQDYMVALQGTRGPSAQDWMGNVLFGTDKWTHADGGQALIGKLKALQAAGAITGDLYFTGQSLGGALAEYAAYQFEKETSFDQNRMALVSFNGLGGIASCMPAA